MVKEYVWCFSFITETISTVGYGIAYRPNFSETLYLYVVIFANMNTLSNLFYQVN